MKKPKRKRCKECNELFTPRYSTLQSACSPMCAIAYSKRRDADIKEENNALLKKAFQEKKNRNKITDLISAVKDVCHKYIRERDKYKPCISCNAPYHADHQAGHFYPAGKFSTIKFNEYNINGQCVQCNIRKGGNEGEYRINLPYRIGEEKFNELNLLASLEKVKNFKWDREELKKIRAYYNAKLKELKQQEV